MRDFNKLFVTALPRCATVSMFEALGVLNVPTSHLGRIYGDASPEHHDTQRLVRIHEQITAGDFRLDILQECRGLVDYPICCISVIERMDREYPGSLFINVRRDRDLQRWLQSVERQFVGLQLLKQDRQASAEDQQFMRVMLDFRAMTFGQSKFDAAVYEQAYRQYQSDLHDFSATRRSNCLELQLENLEESGLAHLSDFLGIDDSGLRSQAFPKSNGHSLAPSLAFAEALEQGRVHSQTGITAVPGH